jgi:competence protein ComEA
VLEDSSWDGIQSLRARLRVDPGRRGAIAVGAAAVLAAILTGIWVLSARPHGIPAAAPLAAQSTPATLDSASRAAPAASSAGEVVVDVAGKVHRPGLVRLPAGSRAFDAVRAAGGPLPGVSLDSIDLAARVTDGEQLTVGAAPAGASGPSVSSGPDTGAAGSGAPPGAPVDLNAAGTEQLQTLPGIGPVLAQHILDWRSAHGRFTAVDQLQQVTGIGPAKYASLKPLVSV